MHRRDLLSRVALLAAGSLAGRLIHAAAAGENLHSAPIGSTLDESQRLMVSHLSELIIPETDTPGARAAGVPDFISLVVSDWYTPRERRVFCEGLVSLDNSCRAQNGKGFNECSAAQQTAMLQALDEQTRSYRSKAARSFDGTDEDSPFFYKLKELTVLGYYTSQVGATTELAYNPVPGRYDGDFDFAEVGRQWSY